MYFDEEEYEEEYEDEYASFEDYVEGEVYLVLNDDSILGLSQNSVKLKREDIEYYAGRCSDNELISKLTDAIAKYYERSHICIYAGKKYFRVIVYGIGEFD